MRALFALCLPLAACHAEPTTPAAETKTSTNARSSRAAPVPIPPQPGAAAGPTVQPVPAAEKSVAAAVAVLRDYCDRVAAKDYAGAFRAWRGTGPAAGKSEAEFARSLAPYASFDCHIGKPAAEEGAAGSIFVDIPLTVTGTRSGGGALLLQGKATLRRVNDVDGSTAEQRRWHLAALDLQPRR